MRTGNHADQQQADILAAARDLLVQEGYASLTMRKIAGRAGCSVGALYLHFENKGALLYALLDTAFERLYQAVAAAAKGSRDPRERLEAVTRAYIDFGLSYPESYQIMFMIHAREMERFPDDMYRRALRLFDPVEETVRAYARAAGNPLPNVRVATVAFWGSVHGLVSLMIAGRLTRLRLGQRRRALIDQVVEQAIAGLTFAAAPLPDAAQALLTT
jgi:AcrR family transcriptional regulator